MSISVKTQGGSGGGPSASIFVRGLSETDVVKAMNRTPLLPDDYTQLEYIESNGTQYIDTGWVPKANSRIEMKCNVQQNATGNFAALFGSCNPTYVTQAWTIFVRVNGTYGIGVERTHPNGNSTMKQAAMYFGEDVTITSSGNTVQVSNGVETITTSDSGNVENCGVSAFLFSMRENNASTWKSYMKLYSFEGYDGDTLARKFVPAQRNSDAVVGLYDLVSATFFENAGTGEFIVGPENIEYLEIRTPKVPNGYTELEYIEGTGTQYIDTGVIATQNTGISLDLIVNNPLSTTAHGSFFGASNNNGAAIWMGTYSGNYSTGAFDFGASRNHAYLSIGTRLQIELKNAKYTISTGNSVSAPTTEFNVGFSAYLFSVNLKGNPCETAKARIYSAVMYDGNAIIRDFVPARRNSDSVIGMYDTVSGEFFENAGTGVFYGGAEVRYVTPTTIEGVWTPRVNPDAILPSSYTQLEYIESTGTQYIDTGVQGQAGLSIELDFETTNVLPSASAKQFALMSCWPDNGTVCVPCWIEDSKKFRMVFVDNGVRSDVSASSPIVTSNTRYLIEAYVGENEQTLSVDGEKLLTTNASISEKSDTLYLGASHDDDVAYQISTGIYRASKMQLNGHDIRHFIPAKRNSDGAIGMYDLVTRTFFENAGTGTFVAGKELDIPAIIYGHLISKIKSLGMWTVTATDGEQIVEQDILIDVVTEYVIDMDYPVNYLMLYDFGDECEEVTGGWSIDGWKPGTDGAYMYTMYAGTKNEDHVSLQGHGTRTIHCLGTNNAIDIAPYSLSFYMTLNENTSRSDNVGSAFYKNKDLGDANNKYFELQSNSAQNVKVRDITGAITTLGTSNPYLFFGVWNETERRADLYALGLAKPDDITTLCSKAGLSAPTDLATLISDTTSISAIMANEEAVKYMVNYCTGDFMVSFIQNADCIEVLQESPYADLVFANKHWKKFLDMVGVKQRLYLYREGDMCEEVTGGFVKTTSGDYCGYALTGIVNFNGDNIYVATDTVNYKSVLPFTNTANKINFSNYKKLVTTYSNATSGSGNDSDRTVVMMLTSDVGKAAIEDYITKGDLVIPVGTGTVEYDISNIYGELYFVITSSASAGIHATIHKVYIE